MQTTQFNGHFDSLKQHYLVENKGRSLFVCETTDQPKPFCVVVEFRDGEYCGKKTFNAVQQGLEYAQQS